MLSLRKKKTQDSHVVVKNLATESIESLSTVPEEKLRKAIELQRKRTVEGKKLAETHERIMSPLYQERNAVQQKIDSVKEKLKNPDLTGSQQLDLQSEISKLRDQADHIEQRIDLATQQELKKQ